MVSVYNRYLNRGGEDVVFESETDLLEKKGNQVIRVEAQVRKPVDPLVAMQMAISSVWSQSWYRKFRSLVDTANPDVIHIHNFWPNLSPSIIYASQRAHVPVVMTLHNYRLLCPAATFYRSNSVCTDCLGKIAPWPSILHGCYQGSRWASGALAGMLTIHRLGSTWNKGVSRYIALTHFARDIFVRGGLPVDRIAIKPNFVEDRQTEAIDQSARHGVLFVGRLSREKGIHTLLTAWSCLDVPLRVIGDGPLLEAVRSVDAPEIVSLGRISSEAVAREMERAAFLVMPSEWYEGFGMVLVEAFSHGLPVIASRLGSMAEIIEQGVTGLLFTPGDPEDLAARVRWAVDHREEMRRMGTNARRIYEERYTPENNYRQLMAIYEEAIEENHRSRKA